MRFIIDGISDIELLEKLDAARNENRQSVNLKTKNGEINFKVVQERTDQECGILD